MPSYKHERRLLLAAAYRNSINRGHGPDSTSSNSSAAEEDEDALERGQRRVERKKRLNRVRFKRKHNPRLKAVKSRNLLQRAARRLILFTLLVPFMLLMLYLPLYTNVQYRHVPLLDWGYNTSRNMADYVLPTQNTTLIEPHNLCQNKIFVLIVVCSSVHNFAARQTIRDTWGNTTEFNYEMFAQMHAHLKGHYLKPSSKRLKHYIENLRLNNVNRTTIPSKIPVRVVFLLGRNKYESLVGNETTSRIHHESEQYNDIVQQDFVDTYNNLTLKSVMALKWVSQRCLQQSAFFMKCDDDTFVNIPNLLHFLLGGTVPLYNDTLELYDQRTYQALSSKNRLNSTSNFLTGHLFCTARPVGNVSSKWYMPWYMYPGEQYPRYLSGAGYLMSMDVVKKLYETALNTSYVYLEDVYLTGIVAEKMNLRRRHHPLFLYTRSKDLCSFKGSITQHEMKDDSLMEAYNFVANVSNRCPPPGQFFKLVRLRKNNSCF